MSAQAILGLGLLFGLKHATEADHIIAVTTIVSGERNLLRAALVGAWWGLGHTLSLVVVGAVVLALRVAIPAQVAQWLAPSIVGLAVAIVGWAMLSSAKNVLAQDRLAPRQTIDSLRDSKEWAQGKLNQSSS